MYTDAARARLLKEQQRLEDLRRAAGRLHAGAKAAAERELSSAGQHPAELTTETIERELDQSVVQHADAELAEIQAALARLELATLPAWRAVQH
jgi:RNA polymerase-binding transcription factor DksA